MEMDIDVAGNNAEYATIVPDGIVEVPAEGQVKLTLAVEVPRASEEGEEIEVLIFAHAVSDPSTSAVARTKTVVPSGRSNSAFTRGVSGCVSMMLPGITSAILGG